MHSLAHSGLGSLGADGDSSFFGCGEGEFVDHTDFMGRCFKLKTTTPWVEEACKTCYRQAAPGSTEGFAKYPGACKDCHDAGWSSSSEFMASFSAQPSPCPSGQFQVYADDGSLLCVTDSEFQQIKAKLAAQSKPPPVKVAPVPVAPPPPPATPWGAYVLAAGVALGALYIFTKDK